MNRTYHQRPGHEPSVKPLALYCERLRCGGSVTDAKLELYMDLHRRWFHARGYRRLTRHFTKVIRIANAIAREYGHE